ncbi:MAG: GNAT family N-acetyltransferase [Verrucomicrobiota bacterium]
MKRFPTIQTTRLTLRGFRIEEASRVQKLAGNPAVAKTTQHIPHPYLDGMAERWISTHLKQFYHQEGITFAIEERESGELIGAIGLEFNASQKRGTLGYWIGTQFWGKGFCTEAAKAVIEYGFTEMNCHKIEANHMKENRASGRVMEKCGMKHEGSLADHTLKSGRFHTTEFYGITKSQQGSGGNFG